KLRAMIPPHCMVARLGGDEFTVLAENAADEREIIHIAETILREIKSPMMVDGHEVYTTVSIGIALSTGDYRRPEEMIRDADTAMYQAKKQGKSRYQIFQAQMRARALEAVRVEADLRRALPGREFELFFQPIVRAQERQVIGFEALIRWNHPERGYISPLDFISVAEETGLIVQMGEWVVREACKAAKRSLGGRYVAVNLSAVQLQQPHFVETIRSALIGAALPPELLLLELTESVLMESDPAALQALGILRDMGVSLAIDDFGTGYSSLSYLKKFPVNVLKIDRSFVRETPADTSSCEITRVILSMCRILGLRVVAEGVENDAQLQFLSGEGCENIQGFFFSRPVPEKNIDSVIRSISGV
ncbi:MAG TPA: bifunctional diguanylate cyclase/phosphodiesterase, partial [Leptospiraceae bacterium]|nr:bifunctional diguanylate cyclase/phosphodiesterase [Leptospiraceae bacterium]